MNSSNGQGLVEYLILVCLIAVSAIAVVSVVGANIREQYANVSATLSNRGDKVTLSKPGVETYKIRGMDDFTDAGKTRK